MNNLYSYCATAMKNEADGSTTFRARTGVYGVTPDPFEEGGVKGFALGQLQQECPEEDGWFKHGVVIERLTDEYLAKNGYVRQEAQETRSIFEVVFGPPRW